MPHPAPAKPENVATMPYRKIKVESVIGYILHLPSGQQIIIHSWDGSFRIWDLERGTQIGEEWEDQGFGVEAMALSPGGKTVATGSWDGAVKLWNVDTGKVIKEWTGHTENVKSMCWSPDGRGRVLSGSSDETFRVWDVESGETDGKMIATGGYDLNIWDANTGELLKTLQAGALCLAWTSDGKTLMAGGYKFDTATWTKITVGEHFPQTISLTPNERIRKTLITRRYKFDTATWTVGVELITADTISISPNERILASTSYFDKTAQLYNLETNKPIGTPLHHEGNLDSATFSTDVKFLVTSCRNYLYTWDVFAITKKAGLPSDFADATPRPAPKMTGAPRIPPGFFNDALREANLRIRLSQSHGPHNHPTPAPRRYTLSSFWRRSKPHRSTEPDAQSRSQHLSWTRNLVSGILRRRDGSDIQLREVEVPCTWAKPRNYHARKKPATSSSRPSNTHTTQQHSTATQSTPSSSQLPPPTAAASTLPAVAGTAGTTSRPNIAIKDSGWRIRLMLWVCCAPIQNTDGQH